MAAKNLTPVALELGGEEGNFAVVRKDADIKDAARKIAFFKSLNAGQICINVNQVAVASEVADKFIKALKMVDRKHDIVAIIRGGSDRNMTCILDAPEIHAALLTMETPTICGVGHTNEHKEFKKYCDHADETPSLLGITLGTWAEEFCP